MNLKFDNFLESGRKREISGDFPNSSIDDLLLTTPKKRIVDVLISSPGQRLKKKLSKHLRDCVLGHDYFISAQILYRTLHFCQTFLSKKSINKAGPTFWDQPLSPNRSSFLEVSSQPTIINSHSKKTIINTLKSLDLFLHFQFS